MRKKIFATLMSVAMVASFMPSLAFAASCQYAVNVTGSTVSWDAVQKALKGDDAKYIEVVKEPTHDEAGTAILTCKADFCGETKEVSITSPCAGLTPDKVEFFLEDYAQRMLEQKDFDNQAQADTWVKNQKADNVCRLEGVEVCPNCGIVITKHANLTSAMKKSHSARGTVPACTDYTCTDCGAVVKGTGHSHRAALTTKDKVAENKVSEPTCGKGTGYKVTCDVCERGVKNPSKLAVAYDTDVKADAHNFGTPVDYTKATKALKTGRELLPGYVAHQIGSDDDSAYTTTTFTNDNLKNYEFFAVNTVLRAGTDCAKTTYGIKCSVCGDIKGSVNGAHDYEETTVAATCDHGSYVKKVCKVCGETTKSAEKNDKLAHTYKATKKDATCTTSEKYVVECTTCSEKACANNHKKTFDAVNHVGLTLVKSTKDADVYTWAGLDNELKGKDVMEFTFTKGAKAHKYGATELIKAATCTDNEVWGKKCTECGKVDHKLVTIKSGTKLGHKFAETEVKATCGTAGYKTAVCERCGEYKADAAGNTTKKADEALKVQTAKPLVAPGAQCTMDKWVVTKKATVFEKGVETLACSKCGTLSGQIAPTPVTKYAAPTVKAGKKSITVTAKVTEGATSYKISYKKAGGKYVTKTVEAGKKVTIKKLAKGKKYTVKAVAINADGVKAFSATKTVKTK